MFVITLEANIERILKNSDSDPSEANQSETERISRETERCLWKYYFVASLIVDMKSFIRLFARIDCKYGLF